MDRYLAIDYGSVRVGTALTDPLKMTAQPYETLPNDAALLSTLQKIVTEKNVSRIVVGNPIQMNGQPGLASEKVATFIQQLQQVLPHVRLIVQDERLSSAEANKFMINNDDSRKKRKEKVDTIAAAIILRSYLDQGAR